MTPPWPHDPREVVRGVLADPRFQRAPQRAGEKSWTDYLAEAFQRGWDWLTAPLQHVTGSRSLTTIVGLAVLTLVAIGLAVVAARYASEIRWSARARVRAVAGAVDGHADARTLLARALAAASEGRHHEAAALLWASALRALDERGRVRFDAARTPGEWRRIVRDPHFDAFARDAVVALFGERGADAALVARMRAAYDRVVPG